MLGTFAILPGRLSWLILLRQSQKEVICRLQVWMPRCWGSVVGGPTLLEGSAKVEGTTARDDGKLLVLSSMINHQR